MPTPDPNVVLASARDKLQELHDDVSRALGFQTTSELAAQSASQLQALQGANDTLTATVNSKNSEIQTLNSQIAAAKIAAQADKDKDASHIAGQGVLDALP